MQDFISFAVQNQALVDTLQLEQVPQKRFAHTASIDHILLYSEALETDVCPLVPISQRANRTGYPLSEISRLKDPQWVMNRVYSQILLHAQNSAGLKLLVPSGSVVDDETLEERWALPNAVIRYNPTVGAKPDAFQPSPLSGEYFHLLDRLAAHIDYVIGIPDIIQGNPNSTPDNYKLTKLASGFAMGRPRGKMQDIDAAMARGARVCHNYIMNHYNAEKMIAIAHPNNDQEGQEAGLYSSKIPTIQEIIIDKKIGHYDLKYVSGSMLPTDPEEEYQRWFQAYKEGLATRKQVWLHNTEMFDTHEQLQEFDQIAQLQQAVAQRDAEIKKLGGDQQTMEREIRTNQRKVALTKFEKKLAEVALQYKSDKTIGAARLKDLISMTKKENEVEIAKINQMVQSALAEPSDNE